MTRTFLAVALSAAAREALRREISSLTGALPSLRWVNMASLHLTLAFLGDLDDERLAAAHEATQAAAQQSAPFALTLNQLGAFGPPHAPRVIWAGVGGEVAPLRRVQRILADELDQRGFPPQEHPFSPHLTLARVRERLPAPERAALQQRANTPLKIGRAHV